MSDRQDANNEDGDSSEIDTPVENDIAQRMIDSSGIHQPDNSEYNYTGDGVWTNPRIIAAIVSGSAACHAKIKAAAAFRERDERPDPLFNHKKRDTFDLVVELSNFPETLRSEWKYHDSVINISKNDEFQKVVNSLIHEKAPFSGNNEKPVIFDEYGNGIETKDEFKSLLAKLGTDAWIVLGIGLGPKGSGIGEQEHLGKTTSYWCPSCDREENVTAVNILYSNRDRKHRGVWRCETCSTHFAGPSPKEVVKTGNRQQKL
jgi:ribosomal protein L37AE/L43A